MKRLLALLLSLLMVCFVGCSQNNNDSSADTDIVSTAKTGKLGSVEFGLGADVEQVKEHYSKLAEEYEKEHSSEDSHNHDNEVSAYYNLIKKDGYSVIDIASARFYYLNDQKEKGIAAVSTDGEVFGFTPGVTMKYEVEEAINVTGDTISGSEEEMKFLAVRTEPIVVLRYDFENIRLDFYFYDNVLISTVILDTNIWEK